MVIVSFGAFFVGITCAVILIAFGNKNRFSSGLLALGLLGLALIVNELKSQLEQWESQYLISAPITGRLSFFNELHEGDFISAGERRKPSWGNVQGDMP